MDVGDVQARNKASQALREGAPELREELRDQHTRLNAERGGGPEVKLPYHGNRSSSAGSEMSNEGSDDDAHTDRDELTAQAAAAQGLYFSGYPNVRTAMLAQNGGRRDPPEVRGEDAPTGPQAAMHAAAEERARRFMMAAAGGSHLMNSQFGGMGMGRPGGMNPFFGGSPAAQMQAAAAFQAAGGAHLLSSPQAMMLAGGPPSAAALLQASRAREFASQIEAANFASAGINPMLLGGQHRGQQSFQDSMRFHELMNAGGVGNKRDREELERERELDENYAKAAKLGRQYR